LSLGFLSHRRPPHYSSTIKHFANPTRGKFLPGLNEFALVEAIEADHYPLSPAGAGVTTEHQQRCAASQVYGKRAAAVFARIEARRTTPAKAA
jgi:hypothetical protein